MRRNLASKGLSLSQAQSISNLCYQRTQDIASQLSGVNNASKTFKHKDEDLIETPGKQLPENVMLLLVEKSKLHACQAFLMEHIKLKDQLIKGFQAETFVRDEKRPEEPEYNTFVMVREVKEQWGWDQLTNAEKNEYLEAEAYASHIGQFIHKGGILDTLRSELPHIKTLQFIELKKDEKTPLIVNVHHTPEQLLKLHNELGAEHRKYEQRVNYFKSKVKNLVTTENARIAKENGDKQAESNAINQTLRSEHQKKEMAYYEETRKLAHDFEKQRQDRIHEVASLRIEIDPRFQEVIDIYMPKVVNE